VMCVPLSAAPASHWVCPVCPADMYSSSALPRRRRRCDKRQSTAAVVVDGKGLHSNAHRPPAHSPPLRSLGVVRALPTPPRVAIVASTCTTPPHL